MKDYEWPGFVYYQSKVYKLDISLLHYLELPTMDIVKGYFNWEIRDSGYPIKHYELVNYEAYNQYLSDLKEYEKHYRSKRRRRDSIEH